MHRIHVHTDIQTEDNLNIPPLLHPQHYAVEEEKVSVMMSLVAVVVHLLVAAVTPS